MYKQVLILSALIYFLQGLKSLSGQPLLFYFKETLGFSASTVMILSSLTTIFWIIKPLYGIIIDRYNFLGYKYKGYIIASLIVSCISALLLGILSFPLVFLLLFLMLDSFAGAIRDVAVDGFSVYVGKKEDVNDKLQTIQWTSLTVAGLLTGIVGGYISEHFTYKVAFLLLFVSYLPAIGYVFRIKEKDVETTPEKFDLRVFIKDKNFLLGAIFLFLLWFSPAIGTPIMYKIRDELHFSRFSIGLLASFGSLMAILGSVIYWFINKKIKFKYLLYGSIFLSAISTFAYLWLTPILVWIYTIVFGITGMISHLTLMTFIANITPRNYESTAFALLCSIVNFGSWCSSFVGAFLFKLLEYNGLIIVSGLFTLAIVFLIPFLKVETEKW